MLVAPGSKLITVENAVSFRGGLQYACNIVSALHVNCEPFGTTTPPLFCAVLHPWNVRATPLIVVVGNVGNAAIVALCAYWRSAGHAISLVPGLNRSVNVCAVHTAVNVICPGVPQSFAAVQTIGLLFA